MARITVEDCIDKFESRFELVLVASNRARKLHSGEAPTVEKDNDKNTVIALREIADETIAIDEMKNNLIEEYQTVSYLNEDDPSLENPESETTEEYTDQVEGNIKQIDDSLISEDVFSAEAIVEEKVSQDEKDLDAESENTLNQNNDIEENLEENIK